MKTDWIDSSMFSTQTHNLYLESGKTFWKSKSKDVVSNGFIKQGFHK